MQWHEKVNDDDLKKQSDIHNQNHLTEIEALDDEQLALEHQPKKAGQTNQIEFVIEDTDQQYIQNICNDPKVDIYSEIELNSNSNEQLYGENVMVDNTFYAEFNHTNNNSTHINYNLHSDWTPNEQASEVNHGERVRALYIQWLELLLYDQMALSQLLQAEAVYIQAFLSEESHFSSHPTRKDIVAFQETVGKVIDSLNEKQRIHIKLLDSSIKLFQQGERVE